MVFKRDGSWKNERTPQQWPQRHNGSKWISKRNKPDVKLLNVRSGANIPGNIRMSFVMSGAQMVETHVETHVETQRVICLSYSNTTLT